MRTEPHHGRGRRRTVPNPLALARRTWGEIRLLPVPSLLWAMVFWGWAAGVTVWLEGAPVAEPPPDIQPQQYSNIQFNGMRFEQKYEDGSMIAVEAPRAWFDDRLNRLILESPTLEWNDPGKDQRFAATANHGEIETTADASALPSEFHVLELRGDARASGQGRQVFSEVMFFNCDTKLFFCPEAYRFVQEGMSLNGAGMSFDPLSGRMVGNRPQ